MEAKSEKLINIYMREERKLFLGGLAKETTEEDLRATFDEFGTIVDCKLMRDHDSREGKVSRIRIRDICIELHDRGGA